MRSLLGLNSPLIVDSVRASLVIYTAFIADAVAGTRDYTYNVQEATSALPRVSAVALANPSDTKEQGVQLPIASDTRQLKDRSTTEDPRFIGDVQIIRRLIGGGACSSAETGSWRLLFRDDKFVYLFATVRKAAGVRPYTLVLPIADRLALVME